MGAPSRLKGHSPQTKAPVLERIDELGMTEKMKTCKDVRKSYTEHFYVLFTDTTEEVVPEWIDRRWPRETLEALQVIDGE